MLDIVGIKRIGESQYVSSLNGYGDPLKEVHCFLRIIRRSVGIPCIIIMMMVRDFQTLLDHATSDIDKARLAAVRADHGSEWIFVLQISACGLRISNEAVRIAICLRLGPNICEPHSCPCSVVDAKGIQGHHASAAHVVPYVTSKSTILYGMLYAEQTLRLSKNRQICSPGLH